MLELIAGPCSAESRQQVLSIAKEIDSIKGVKWFRAGIWKPRTRPNQFEGVGEKGLPWLNDVKKTTSLKTITEVAIPLHIEKCLENNIDGIWIGARTTTNPFYIQEISESLRGVDIPVFIKNPLNPDIKLWIGAIERIKASGIKNVYAVHRGFSFADNGVYRQTPYWKIPIELKRLMPDIPIICDPSHIGGKASLVKEISQSSINIGLNGLMIEVHNSPENALTDSSQQITPYALRRLLEELIIPQNSFEEINPIFTIREEIDSLDFELINIINQRMSLAIEIAKIKKEKNIPILQIKRLDEMIIKRLEKTHGTILDKGFIKDIFESIHQESIRIQNEIFKDK
ncbi:MAG: bifunctional 3-deoxy-7-phosphoheptulonate synthase/chorismate mutase type II [Bacteroidales bacterium]|nr:bifunctional 3-deoxy-7-phosphoheptulonate synthase/chorismate mutase type II [Bacteroidales bacterium]